MLRKYVSTMENELSELASGMHHQAFAAERHSQGGFKHVGPSAGTQLTDKWQRKMGNIVAPSNSSDRLEEALYTKVDLKQMLMSLQS